MAIAVCVANLCLSGCYAYTPVQTAAVNPDDQVRVIVSRETANRLARDFGTVAPELEGQLRPMGRDSLAFNIWIGKAFSGSDFAGAQQTLPLARSDIREVYRRQLSAKRTTLFALGVVAAAAILVNRLAPGERNPGDDPIEPPPPPVDLIRVRWHF